MASRGLPACSIVHQHRLICMLVHGAQVLSCTAAAQMRHIGQFATEEEAARAFDAAALEVFGHHSSTPQNFPSGAGPSSPASEEQDESLSDTEVSSSRETWGARYADRCTIYACRHCKLRFPWLPGAWCSRMRACLCAHHVSSLLLHDANVLQIIVQAWQVADINLIHSVTCHLRMQAAIPSTIQHLPVAASM